MSTKCPLGILGKTNFMPENLSERQLVICLFNTWFWFFSLYFWFVFRERCPHFMLCFFVSHFLSILVIFCLSSQHYTSTYYNLGFCLSLYLPHPKPYNTFWFCPFRGLLYLLKLAYGTDILIILIQFLVCVSGWQVLATNDRTCQLTAAYTPS